MDRVLQKRKLRKAALTEPVASAPEKTERDSTPLSISADGDGDPPSVAGPKELLGLTVNTQALGRMIQKTKQHLRQSPTLRPPPKGHMVGPASPVRAIRPATLCFEAAGARGGGGAG